MTTLLIADHANGHLSDATAKALTAAIEMGAPVHVLVAGENVAEIAAQAARLSGVTKVLSADHALYAHGLAEPTAALIVSLSSAYSAIVGCATASACHTPSCQPPKWLRTAPLTMQSLFS